ncbi:MAG: energy-coupled thiamine transporter ThiT [Butyrivibrio sp.]|uniref:energy-coupled thiamine transporter ThiT n=1 Tax=Butyrivibrio sp. TaxID=28121 RepID=UPI001B18EB75|nr:energy-coupled thiamine transporter ThiT [Butyrivibrio sp.]MBO6241349.1 energy-coupled thiamine transporter ThiT [Butyrivibrio sp.]
MDLFLQDVSGEGVYSFTTGGYVLFVGLMVLALLVVSYFVNKDGKGKMSIKQLTTSALCIALAFVLSNVKLFKAPMGGSVTAFSMFFITFIGYMYGPRVSLSAAFAYGLLQMIVDPYIVSVPQLICDYVLAFTALGIAGFFSNAKYGMFKGYVAGVLGRYFFAVLSGVVFFADYAPEGMSPVVYSALYNGAYLSLEAILTLVVLFVPAVRNGLNRLKNEANEVGVRKEATV